MHKTLSHIDSTPLVGITVRTKNANEMDPSTAKIAPTIETYHQQNIAASIRNRQQPGITYHVYTDYESDEHGEYTFFIGEAVTEHSTPVDSLTQLSIPAGPYQMFTTASGARSQVVIEAWQAIWAMNEAEMGGERRYQVDFERYDARAQDPNHSIVDIYIGLK